MLILSKPNSLTAIALKRKCGLSMQGWIYRAKDLGITSEGAATRLFRQFRHAGWHEQEPGDQLPSEEPSRMARLVLRALSEDLVSESRAAELLGEPLTQFFKKANIASAGLSGVAALYRGHQVVEAF